MAFYMRFFGTGAPPSPDAIASAAGRLDPAFAFERIGLAPVEAWRVERDGVRSIYGLIDVVARGDEAFETEIAEFARALPDAEGERDTVAEMLKRCDFIASVDCMFVTRDLDATKAGLAPIWDWLTSTYAGLTHVDDEGFYRDDELILALP